MLHGEQANQNLEEEENAGNVNERTDESNRSLLRTRRLGKNKRRKEGLGEGSCDRISTRLSIGIHSSRRSLPSFPSSLRNVPNSK